MYITPDRGDADAYLYGGYYGHGLGYSGFYGHGLGHGYSFYGKREAEPKAAADAYLYGGYGHLGYAGHYGYPYGGYAYYG